MSNAQKQPVFPKRYAAYGGTMRRTMKSKFFRSLLALTVALCLLAALPSLAEARYPAQGETVTDDANVLSQTMTRDIASYAEEAESETNVKIHVALVSFLDGETPQKYTDALFTRWGLGENDLLLMGAAAEDTFAFSAGVKVTEKLSSSTLSSLLYSSGFSGAFQTQRYDDAFGALFVNMNTLLNKQYDADISLGSLFKNYQTGNVTANTQDSVQQAAQSVADSANELWTSTINSITDSVQNYQNYHTQHEAESGGMSAGWWIILLIIFVLVFGQGRRGRYRGGCGCSPIGWILGGLGLGALFNRHNGDAERNREEERRWRHEQREHRRDCRW
ncbi:MAG TPA: TPM domain-containing protein [Candidatus Limiplasma sp.]|jgi:hypothetical protein|nr:TPM domain-containing protein [Candidatus Limiplasma sp.]